MTITTDAQVNGSLAAGALTAVSVESVAVDTTRVAAIDSVGIALCTQAYSVAFSVQDNQDCTAHRNLTVVGDLTVNGNISGVHSPFWVAGRVNGIVGETSILTSKGRYAIGFQRLQAGLYKITWTEPHPDNGNVVVLAQGEGTGGAWQILHDINDANRNTATSVTFTVRNNNFNTVDGIVNFAVLA